MRKQIKLSGWYGIGSREVVVHATASRKGYRIEAYLPTESIEDMLDGDIVRVDLTWDEVESRVSMTYSGQHGEDLLRQLAHTAAKEVVRKALPRKKPGEVYSDGSE